MTLRNAIMQVQQIGLTHGFNVVIVGGGFVRLIGKKTTIKKIDVKEKTIFLAHAENPGITREDGKTTVDIDCIAFSNADDPFTQEVKQNFSSLKKALLLLQKSQHDFPAVSLEPVLYHPYFPKPNAVTQFVSSIESYHDHDYFFRLGSMKQDVRKASLTAWAYIFENQEKVISFSPLAVQNRYAIRGFSAKPKDVEKIWGKSAFSEFVTHFNKKTDNVYAVDFAEWDTFAKHVQTAKQPSMQIKRNLWNAYWQTIGTYLAHGTGFVGKILLPLGNTFFAGK